MLLAPRKNFMTLQKGCAGDHERHLAEVDCIWLQVVEEGLQGYEVPGPDLDALHQQLEAFGRARVESAAHEAAHTALPRMKDRFTEVRFGFVISILLQGSLTLQVQFRPCLVVQI